MSHYDPEDIDFRKFQVPELARAATEKIIELAVKWGAPTFDSSGHHRELTRYRAIEVECIISEVIAPLEAELARVRQELINEKLNCPWKRKLAEYADREQLMEKAREFCAKWITSDEAFRRKGELLVEWEERKLAAFALSLGVTPSGDGSAHCTICGKSDNLHRSNGMAVDGSHEFAPPAEESR